MPRPVVGDLPLACAATCNVSVLVQEMSVKAAVTGDALLLKQAMLHDPLTGAVCDPEEIWQMTDEMLIAGEKWLPQYVAAGAQRARDVLREIPIKEILQRVKKAGELYTKAELPLGDGTQTPDQFARMQSATTGLPEHMCKFNMEKNMFVLQNMDKILDSLTRGLDLSILSRGHGMEDRKVPVS